MTTLQMKNRLPYFCLTFHVIHDLEQNRNFAGRLKLLHLLVENVASSDALVASKFVRRRRIGGRL